jgi:S-adenosylmethionine:tRNA-ribosyltransferase-isomerase (queuine synthetase)
MIARQDFMRRLSKLIAQEPLEQPDQARLMVVERRTGALAHSRSYKLPRELG